MAGQETPVELVPALLDGLFDRAHIGDHGVRRQGRHQGGVGIQQAIEGQGQDHQAAVLEHGRVGLDPLGQPPFPGPFGRAGAMHQGPHLEALGLQIKPQGSADQPQAHDPDGSLAPVGCHR